MAAGLYVKKPGGGMFLLILRPIRKSQEEVWGRKGAWEEGEEHEKKS